MNVEATVQRTISIVNGMNNVSSISKLEYFTEKFYQLLI